MAGEGRYEDSIRKPGEERFCRLIVRHLGNRDSIDLHQARSIEKNFSGQDFRVTDEITPEGHPCVCFWAQETKWVIFKKKLGFAKEILTRLGVSVIVGGLSTLFLGFAVHCLSFHYGFKVNWMEFSIGCTAIVTFLFFFLSCLLSSNGDNIVAGP